jgi:hypothetical protein
VRTKMSEAKHTPGPWSLNGVDCILSVHGNRTIAKVFHPSDDARLIASAPDLLEACRFFVDAFPGREVSQLGNGKARQAYDRCVAALAKAEGRA